MLTDDTANDATAVLDSLSELLEREATALKTADFAALAPLADEKERLAKRLSDIDVDCPPDLARALQARAQRNAMLLEAAQSGLKQAHDRLRELTAPPPPLQTYDGTGRRCTLPPPPGTARRA